LSSWTRLDLSPFRGIFPIVSPFFSPLVIEEPPFCFPFNYQDLLGPLFTLRSHLFFLHSRSSCSVFSAHLSSGTPFPVSPSGISLHHLIKRTWTCTTCGLPGRRDVLVCKELMPKLSAHGAFFNEFASTSNSKQT